MLFFLCILGKKFSNTLQQLIFKNDSDKVNKVSLVSFKESMNLNAKKVSDQYFKAQKQKKQIEFENKEVHKIESLVECIICYDKKANCL